MRDVGGDGSSPYVVRIAFGDGEREALDVLSTRCRVTRPGAHLGEITDGALIRSSGTKSGSAPQERHS
jgi:hypothetical protein